MSLVKSTVLFLAVSTFAQAAEVPVPTIIDPAYFTVRDQLASAGYYKWLASGTDCLNCQTLFVGTTIDLQTEAVQKYMSALGEHKAEILALYRGKRTDDEMQAFGDDYNALAKMAVGILGCESKFFTSTWYQLKEEMPGAVHIAKSLLSLAEGKSTAAVTNSRGPTQIKSIPQKVAVRYGITPDNLSDPENAAIATVAFLIESLNELHRLASAHHLTEITRENEMSYVPYIYFGSMRRLINHEASPEKNVYVSHLRQYMSRVEIFEKPTL